MKLIGKVRTRGRVTIPKELRDLLHIKPGDQVQWYRERDGLKLRILQKIKQYGLFSSN